MTGEQVDRTLWVGNLDPRTTEELLYELFVQAGPLIDVKIAKDKDGNKRNYAFIEYKHDISIPYTIQLMNGIRLFDRALNLQCRPGSKHIAAVNAMGRNSPLPTPEGRNSRPQTPNTPLNLVDAGMDCPHFHRSHSMPDNLSSFANQRRMLMSGGHPMQRSSMLDQFNYEHYRPMDYGSSPQEYGRQYLDYGRPEYSRKEYEQREYGRPQDYGRQNSRGHLPHTPLMSQRYRSSNMPPKQRQPSGHRGHYGYS
ncbi:RNA-binding protein 7-like [Ptychodera flava]|uniref:RNA-binding protein 7-like n=1 Tax=Ptychodera flava TaxID=63121 RepID=UPI00396A8808